MNNASRVVIVLLVAVAVVTVLALKNRIRNAGPELSTAARELRSESGITDEASTNAALLPDENAPDTAGLPRLVDLGADKCIPCKMMAPVLDALKKECADTFTVEFIDVWENPEAGQKYGIRVIPTQIFYDADGKELFRHEGFFGKQDILAKWREHGVDVPPGREG